MPNFGRPNNSQNTAISLKPIHFDTLSKKLDNPPDPRMQMELDRSEFGIKAKKAK